MFDNSNEVYIIAEAGVNHNGSRDMAFKLVDAAVTVGADAIKFQTFRAEKLVTSSAGKAPYQEEEGQGGSQLDMLRELELPFQVYVDLAKYCEEKGIAFLSTAFDLESLDFLVQEVGVPFLKIPSGEITNGPFLLAHARTGKKILLSTGMSTLNEVRDALGVIAFGYTEMGEPTRRSFRHVLAAKEGKHAMGNVVLLHCTSAYPANIEDVDLRSMETLKERFKVQVGYSDHTEGIMVSVAAVCLGARVIEKHFTLNNFLPGPDHKASLEPSAFRAMVQAIRNTEKALGYGGKQPTQAELINKPVVRKSLVAKRKIDVGELFTEDNVTAKRPGSGISPMEYWDVIGTVSDRYYNADEEIY